MAKVLEGVMTKMMAILTLKKQDKKIESLEMESAWLHQENKENVERNEKDNKVNVKELLNTRRTASDNQSEIPNLKKVMESHSFKNWMPLIKWRVEHDNYFRWG